MKHFMSIYNINCIVWIAIKSTNKSNRIVNGLYFKFNGNYLMKFIGSEFSTNIGHFAMRAPVANTTDGASFGFSSCPWQWARHQAPSSQYPQLALWSAPSVPFAPRG